MHQSFLAKHTHASTSIMPSIIHQCLHHHTMRLQKIFFFESIECRIHLVSLDGIPYLLNLLDRSHHILTINDVAHLIFTQFVSLNGQ